MCACEYVCYAYGINRHSFFLRKLHVKFSEDQLWCNLCRQISNFESALVSLVCLSKKISGDYFPHASTVVVATDFINACVKLATPPRLQHQDTVQQQANISLCQSERKTQPCVRTHTRTCAHTHSRQRREETKEEREGYSVGETQHHGGNGGGVGGK